MRRWRVRKYSYWLVAIPTVTLCLGANLVVLAVANALWFKPRGVKDIDSLVVVMHELGPVDSGGLTPLGLTIAAEIIGAASTAGQALTSGERSTKPLDLWHPGTGRELETAGVTSNYFDVLGVPVTGLDLSDTEQSAGSPGAIISDRLWESAFGRGPVAGRRLQGPKHSVTIAGVAAPGFQGARLGEQIDVWVDVDSGLFKPAGREPVSLFGIFRLPPGTTAAAAQRRMEQHPRHYFRNVIPLAAVFGSAQQTMIAFSGDGLLDMAGVLSLVIFVCGWATLTVTVLMMLEHRRTEFGIRCSLGANRRTLLTALGLEFSAMLAVSLFAAVTLAAWTLRAIPSLSLGQGVVLQNIDLTFDTRLGLVSVLALCAMSLMAMAGPVWLATGAASNTALNSTARTDLRARRRQEILLSVQVGAALICAVIGVQFVQTVRGLRSGTGFDSGSTVFVAGRTRHLVGDPANDNDPANANERSRAEAASRRLIDRVLAVPGVTGWAPGRRTLSARATRELAISRTIGTADGEVSVRAGVSSVGPGFLQALGITARSGKLPASAEETMGGRAVVLTSSLAHQIWEDDAAVGKPLTLHSRTYTVVGVVDTWYGAVQYGAAPAIFIFDYSLLANGFDLAVAFRARDAAQAKLAIAEAVKQEFPDERIEVFTGDELVARDLERERIGTWLFTGYGVIACLLALGGVLALVSYTLRTTRRELGIRAALGASRGRLLRHCAAVAGRPVAIGAFAGAVLSPLFTSLAQASFVGLTPVGAASPFLAAAVVALAASAIAAWQSGRAVSTPPHVLLQD